MLTKSRRLAYVILDRDGTVNVERHYLSDPAELDLLPDALPGLTRMAACGLGLIVATNQSGVGRGYFDETTLRHIHGRFESLLAAGGVTLDGIFVCPHRPEDGCSCRKPEPGLVLEAASQLGFDPAGSFVVGDKESDLELGRRVGAFTILVRTGYGASLPPETVAEKADAVARDLSEAAAIIEGCLRARGLLPTAEISGSAS